MRQIKPQGGAAHITKNDIDRYAAGQIYLLKSGKYVLITDCDPITKLMKTDEERYCYVKAGKTRTGKEIFAAHSLLVSSTVDGVDIVFDIEKTGKVSISELRTKEACYIGMLSPVKKEQLSSLLNEV